MAATALRTVRVVLEIPQLAVGEYWTPARDDAWRHLQAVGEDPHVVFHRHPVLVVPVGREPVLATANHAMLYDGGDEFRRERRSESGDESLFVALRPQALDELAQDDDALVDTRGRMRRTHARVGRAASLLRHVVARQLRAPRPDRLLVAEVALRLISLVLHGGGEEPRHRPATAAAHRALAEAAKAELSRELAVQLELDELARKLHVSPFHLAHVFRAETGFTLYGYRQQLRLREALARFNEGAANLAIVALELGFASHSHFTDAFRIAFGVPPSAVRDEREVRRILEAASALPT